MPLTLLAPHTPQLFSGAVSWQSSSEVDAPNRFEPMSEMNRTDCHRCPSCPIDRRASEEERRTYYERYAKARAHEVDRCRDVRWATRGTIVRERLKCEGYLWLRQRGVS